jgi:predicted metal-binding membrane protein
MLPTAWPLLGMFNRLTAARQDRGALRGLLIFGYLLIWGVFGLLAHAIDNCVHMLVADNPWLIFNGWIVGAAMLGLAGAFQFSVVKYHCLEKCRTPFGFVNRHWRAEAPRRQAFVLGVHHGIYCVGCCWAIMMLMFVVGTGNVGVMLVLGALMAVEKNVAWGRRLSAPLGIGLLLWSGVVVLQHL